MATEDEHNEKRFRATTPTRRFMKLAGMSANIAKNYTSHKMKGMFADDETKKKSQEQLLEDIGKQVAQTLGEMKGAVMKVGQIASQLKDLLPAEIAEALAVLQKESPPMPYSMIKRQLIKSLGHPPEELFGSFDEKPFAAASIGQVHKATTKDGVECVVKIQYPGVQESCDSDLRHLRRLLKLAGLAKVSGEIIDATFDEIRRTLLEELDYVHEAENLTFFAEHYRDNPKIIVPELIPDLSSEKVLTLTYVEGDSLKDVKAPRYSQEIRNEIGYRIFETIGRQIYELKAVHSDPHPGNFAFRPDGSLIIFDFGAVKRIEDATIEKLRALASDAVNGNIDKLDQHLVNIGVRNTTGPDVTPQYYQEWLDIVLEPFASYTPYNFATSRLHKDAIKKVRKDAMKYFGSFQPAPDTMQVDRVISGHYWTMVDLGVNVAFRPLIDEIVLRKAAV